MQLLQARWMTGYVQDWMERSSAVSVLHVFDRVCNLVNERGEVVSLVTAEVGRGPFAVIVEPQRGEEECGFRGYVKGETAVFIRGDVLQLGDMKLNMSGVQAWEARLAWEQIRPFMSRHKLPGHPSLGHQYPGEQTTPGEPGCGEEWMGENRAVRERLKRGTEMVLQAVKVQDRRLCSWGTERLAGVGEGLTPAGDDFLMGVMIGLWATRPDDEADKWGKVIVETAVPRSTTLSAAWLKAAARGEVAEVWHQLVEVVREPYSVFNSQLAAVQRILTMGHTSGKATWAGFMGMMV